MPPRPGDLQSLRTFPELGTIIQLQHIGNSIYQFAADQSGKARHQAALFSGELRMGQIDRRRRLAGGSGNFDSFGAQDERNLRLERGLSFFDVRCRLSGGWVYSIPAAPVWKPVLNNWQLSGNFTLPRPARR